MKKFIVVILSTVTLFSCSNTPENKKSIGDKTVELFPKSHLFFSPDKNKTNLDDKIIKIDAGRILLTKVKLPKYNKNVRVNIKAKLTSAGDPWDKTGSLFIIPSTSDINFLIENNKFKELFSDNEEEDFFPGIVSEKGYKPAIEVLRFMTPFGVGFYSETPKLQKRKPVYIPKWEDEVVWNDDVTQLLSELEEDVWVGVFIDVWTKEGYNFEAKLIYDESDAPVDPYRETKVISLVNTTRYIAPERLFDGFNRKDINVKFNVPKGYSSVKLYYITTGHGGHSGGDEFVKELNKVSVDGSVIYSEIPWRDDCASFRRFNPHSGVWTEKRIAVTGNLKTGDVKESEIDEFIASSDYSRSNWCPGSQVEPIVLPLGKLTEGEHSLRISIPEAQQEKEGELNHWNVSAYIVLNK
jgi:hypothetical protein